MFRDSRLDRTKENKSKIDKDIFFEENSKLSEDNNLSKSNISKSVYKKKVNDSYNKSKNYGYKDKFED